MTRVYTDIKAHFEFETSLDGSAIPVAVAHLARLLNDHDEVCGFHILETERVNEWIVRIHAHLLLEQEFSPFYRPDSIGDSFNALAGASHDIELQGAPLPLTRLHRTRLLS